jgi:hypothetical protein
MQDVTDIVQQFNNGEISQEQYWELIMDRAQQGYNC